MLAGTRRAGRLPALPETVPARRFEAGEVRLVGTAGAGVPPCGARPELAAPLTAAASTWGKKNSIYCLLKWIRVGGNKTPSIKANLSSPFPGSASFLRSRLLCPPGAVREDGAVLQAVCSGSYLSLLPPLISKYT